MKSVLYMDISLNGYIAKENGETPWSQCIWDSYYRTAKEFKAIILGRVTYELMKEVAEFDKLNNPFTVVVTTQRLKSNNNLIFVNTPKQALKLLKEKGFENVLILGGGILNSSFMKEGLIDELYLDIEPIIFGRGIPLFSENDFEARLEFLDSKKLSPEIIQLHYKIKK